MSVFIRAVERLQRGERVTIRPHGNSMRPLIASGATVILEPLEDEDDVQVGDVVLVRVRGALMLHLVKALAPGRVLIGNNRGHLNGWTGRSKVYGRAVEVEGRRLCARGRSISGA